MSNAAHEPEELPSSALRAKKLKETHRILFLWTIKLTLRGGAREINLWSRINISGLTDNTQKQYFFRVSIESSNLHIGRR